MHTHLSRPFRRCSGYLCVAAARIVVRVVITAILLLFGLKHGAAVAQQQKLAKPSLSCTVQVPELRWLFREMRFEPDPLPVTITVTNTGDQLADSVFATIVLPRNGMLTHRDSLPTVPLTPAWIFPGQSASVVRLLRIFEGGVSTVGVRAFTRRGDSAHCETILDVPDPAYIDFSPYATIADPPRVADDAAPYSPNPFMVTLTCINRVEGTAARKVEATITLPEHLVLDPPEQQATVLISDSLARPAFGTPAPTVTWSLRWTHLDRDTIRSTLGFAVTALGPDSLPVGPWTTQCSLTVPGLPRSLSGFICAQARGELPGSLACNEDSTDYVPNPIEMHWGLFFQSGWLPIRLTHAELRFPGADGLRLDDATPRRWDGDTLLNRGDTLLFFYRLHVEARPTRRLPLIAFRLSDGDGEWGGEHYVTIPGLPHVTEYGVIASPGGLTISAPRPHPVQGRAYVTIALRDAGVMEATLQDLAGRRVCTLHQGWMLAGEHELVLDRGTLTPGFYMLMLRMVGGGSARRGMVLQ
ncbi:MAG: hypothetical protein M5R41_02030 [Bacteroidia bacterium]|nr:hypothetical protein [Bacteroidia bacterium]